MKTFCLVAFIIFLNVNTFAQTSPSALFPDIKELPGGKEHWVHSVLPEEKKNGCTIYSSTYAYFAEHSKPLFDIPRKNVYSVNVRFHVCDSVKVASNLYDTFSKVGSPKKKHLMSVGEKSILYIEPDKNPLMGNYYLTSLYRYIVMQIHSDDGFVLMDIGDTMTKRLASYLSLDDGSSNVLTLSVSKDGYDPKQERVTFSGENIKSVVLSGTVFDEQNKRISAANIRIMETGETFYTDDKGNFIIELGAAADDKKNKSTKLFRSITIAHQRNKKTLTSGYFKVDYSQQDTVSQNVWKLWIAPDGKINGISLNLADQKTLILQGKLTTDSLSITRNCGSSFMGNCKQVFIAKKDDGIFKGKWNGTGGGGDWQLYIGSFDEKPSVVSLKEADFNINPSSAKEMIITTGKPAKMLTIIPEQSSHDDFYVSKVNLLMDISAINSKDGIIPPVYLYGANSDTTLDAIESTTTASPASFDISSIYRAANNDKYLIGFSKNEVENISAKITPKVEVSFAVPRAKSAVSGTVKASLHNINAEDYASNKKVISGDSKPDIALKLNVSAYGSILRQISITLIAKNDVRRWNTDTKQINPGVALVKDDTVLNKPDGSVDYPMEYLSEDFYLYISQGSLDVKSIQRIELTLHFDGDKVTVPVHVK